MKQSEYIWATLDLAFTEDHFGQFLCASYLHCPYLSPPHHPRVTVLGLYSESHQPVVDLSSISVPEF